MDIMRALIGRVSGGRHVVRLEPLMPEQTDIRWMRIEARIVRH